MKIHNLRHIGHLDLPGGGQVSVKDRIAYVGHMEPPLGTSIVDVANPKAPRILAQLEVPSNTHSHKARVTDHLLVVNYERCRTTPEVMRPGFKILDVSSPSNPREIAFVETGGIGVHRFDLDSRYAYISTELEGYVGAITVVYDLADPTKVKEVGRWWQPGQWTGGGERPNWQRDDHRTHHPLRWQNRLYIGCNYIVPESAVENRAGRFGCHQPQEQVYDTILAITWFSGGLRLVNIANPYRPEEVGYFIPDPAKGYRSAQSNDVFYDGDGLLYVIDRHNGLDILERTK